MSDDVEERQAQIITDRFRDFDQGVDAAEGKPIQFKLGGEVFTCIPVAPAGVLADVTNLNAIGIPDVNRFFRGVLVDDDVALFTSVIYAKKNPVSIEQLTELIAYLIEEYTGKKLRRPKRS